MNLGGSRLIHGGTKFELVSLTRIRRRSNEFQFASLFDRWLDESKAEENSSFLCQLDFFRAIRAANQLERLPYWIT